MAYQSVTWQYGVVLSGLTFPLQTASGTFVATNYGSGGLSGSISVNGGPWTALGYLRINVSTPGNGMYTITSLSSVEMSSYTWAVMITATSGCIAQGIIGTNLSGPARATDVSALAGTLVAVSALPVAVASGFLPILTAVSNTNNNISGLPGMMTAVSGIWKSVSALNNIASIDYSGIALQTWNTVISTATSSVTFGGALVADISSIVGGSVNISSIANQVWNTVQTTATSATTFGGMVNVSGLVGILTAVSNIPLAVASGFSPILTAVSANSMSSYAGQVWNTYSATYSSGPTFGGMHMQAASGILATLVAVSAIPLAVASGWVGVSAELGILTAVSAIPLAVASGWVGLSTEQGILTAVSNITATVNLSAVANQVWNTLLSENTSSTTFGNLQNTGGSVNLSAVANQVWNTLLANNTSATTFGNLQNAGGSVNLSAVALQVWNTVQTTATSATTFGGMVNVSGLNNILTAVSNIPLAVASGWVGVSAELGILTAISAIPLAVASGFAPVLTAVSNVPLAVASGWVGVSGNNSILTAVSALVNSVSGLQGLQTSVSGIPLAVGSGWVGCSGMNGVMGAVSGVPSAVGLISCQDTDTLVSGTLAHTARMLRWFSWGNLVIDKTYSPQRLYLQTDATNVSSWWSLTDNAGSTNRTRGG